MIATLHIPDVSARYAAVSLLCLSVACAFGSAQAQTVTVTGGAAISLGAGTLDVGCGDLDVAGGTVLLQSGLVENARNVLLRGGLLLGGSGRISLSGHWSNSGSFDAGSSEVLIVDGCGASVSQLRGSTTFSRFSMVSDQSKVLEIEAGSTQTFLSQLVLAGTAGAPLVVRSTVAGSPAMLVLDEGAGQSISFVDVADNNASGGQTIAPGTASNFGSVAGGNLANWFTFPPSNFDDDDPVPVPALPWPATLLLALLLLSLVDRGSWMANREN